MTASATPPARPIDRLLAVMARLRDRKNGCPWDVAQDFSTIAPYTIEEAYEVYDAIERGDRGALRDELGDLLLQVVFHARMAEEEGSFDFDDVAAGIAAKMLERHPHVFGEERYADLEAQTRGWEQIKAEERAAKGQGGVLDGVPPALPALLRAWKLQRRAARVGFDWPAAAPVLDKLQEEIAELQAEMAEPAPRPERLEEELGDLLFSVVNLARHLGIEPEAALRRGNAKFERRFRALEAGLAAAGLQPQDCDLDRLEAAWRDAKAAEGEDRRQAAGEEP